jgi:hypothetical protein
MNFQKLDAALAAALSERRPAEQAELPVSVRTQAPPDAAQQKELEELGVYGASGKGRVFSAQLSPRAVAALSEKPWVRLLSLAQTLKPLG